MSDVDSDLNHEIPGETEVVHKHEGRESWVGDEVCKRDGPCIAYLCSSSVWMRANDSEQDAGDGTRMAFAELRRVELGSGDEREVHGRCCSVEETARERGNVLREGGVASDRGAAGQRKG